MLTSCTALRDQLHRLLDLIEAGQARCQADVAVARILAERERRAGLGQLDAGCVRHCHDRRRAAVERVEADEVSAFRPTPLGDAGAAELALENLAHGVELRFEDRCVALHVCCDAGGVFEEAHVAQLIDLVVPDRLNRQPATRWRIGRAGSDGADAGAGEADLRRR
jgi:hypothetical protein